MNETYHHYSCFMWPIGPPHFGNRKEVLVILFCVNQVTHVKPFCVIHRFIISFPLCLLSRQCSRPVKDMINLFRKYLSVSKRIRRLNSWNIETFFKTEMVEKPRILCLTCHFRYICHSLSNSFGLTKLNSFSSSFVKKGNSEYLLKVNHFTRARGIVV